MSVIDLVSVCSSLCPIQWGGVGADASSWTPVDHGTVGVIDHNRSNSDGHSWVDRFKSFTKCEEILKLTLTIEELMNQQYM